MKLWMKILIGMFLGLVVGALLGPKASYLKGIGQIFLNMVSMIIVPLMFSSVVVGITSIEDPKKLGRVGFKSFGVYLATTFFAISLGLIFAYIFKPGMNLEFFSAANPAAAGYQETKGVGNLLLEIVPKNPFDAFAKGSILQVIVFAIFVGVAIQFTKKKAEPFLNFIESVSEVMGTLTGIIMKFAPIGVFAIMASVAGTFGFSILIPLAKLLGTIYLASLVQFFICNSAILLLLCRLNPIHFFKGMLEAIVLAFSTCSSSAAIPLTMQCAVNNLGVSKNIAKFVIPFGSSINMNGTAIFQAISAVFIAQMYHIDLGMHQIVAIFITCTLAAIGTAGVPGAGFLILSMVLKAVGLPLEGLAIIFAIDRLRDMVGTVVNIVGDAVVAVYIAKTEGELDVKKYQSPNVLAFESSKV